MRRLVIVQSADAEPYGEYAASVTRNDITWTFDANGPGPGGTYLVGTFWNGDPWVKDPGAGVGIASWTPNQSGSGATKRNGSMVNPVLGDEQGYDGRADGYDDGYTAAYPLTLDAGESLVTSRSRPESDSPRACITGASLSISDVVLWSSEVLTCLSSGVASTAFRPPFCGSAKPIYYTSDVLTGLLPSLTTASSGSYVIGTTIAGSDYCKRHETYFKRPHLLHCTSGADVGQKLHALDNMYYYYGAHHSYVSEAALLCCCSDQANRLDTVNALIQHGIDEWGTVQTDTTPAKRVDRLFTKFPMLLAGKLLGISSLLAGGAECYSSVWDTSWYIHDSSTYAGSSLWHGMDSAGYRHKFTSDADDPADTEFEHWHPIDDGWCGVPSGESGFFIEGYRHSTRSWTWVGMALAAIKIGLKSAWNHDPFFAYAVRWMEQDEDALSPNFATLSALSGTDPCSDGSAAYLYKQGGCPTTGFWVVPMWTANYSAGEW